MRYPSFPLLTQPEEINETLFCDENNKLSCDGSICMCQHRLKVHLNSIVEIVLYDFKSDGKKPDENIVCKYLYDAVDCFRDRSPHPSSWTSIYCNGDEKH